jgi:hypothetical protein
LAKRRRGESAEQPSARVGIVAPGKRSKEGEILARLSAIVLAAVAAAAIGGCGGSSSSGRSPVQVGDDWYKATAAGDGAKLCALSTADRQARFVELAKRLPGGKSVSACPAAVNLTLEHFGGGARLSKLAKVHVKLVKQSGKSAEVQAPNAAPLKLVKSGSSWRVSGAGASGK